MYFPRSLAAAVAVVALSWTASAGAPFATDDPEPTADGHYEVYLFSEATWGGDTQTGTAIGVEVDYGVLPDVQLAVALPVGFDIPDDEGPRFGIGDASIGVKYRFIHEDESGWMPQMAIYPSFQAALVRSGSNGGDRPTHLILPVWASKSIGAWNVFGGGGWHINDGVNVQNSSFAGLGATTDLDRDLTIGAEVYRESSESIGGNATTAFSFGGNLALNDSWHLLGSIGVGVEDQTAATSMTSYVALKWTD
jgi:hypothetical protein